MIGNARPRRPRLGPMAGQGGRASRGVAIGAAWGNVWLHVFRKNLWEAWRRPLYAGTVLGIPAALMLVFGAALGDVAPAGDDMDVAAEVGRNLAVDASHVAGAVTEPVGSAAADARPAGSSLPAGATGGSGDGAAGSSLDGATPCTGTLPSATTDDPCLTAGAPGPAATAPLGGFLG